MLALLKKFRQDEYGVILSTELVIVGTVLVIGMISGITCLQTSVEGELKDLANAIGSLDQSYAFTGHVKPGSRGHCCAYTAGSSFLNCEEKHSQQVEVIGAAAHSSVAVADSCHRCGATVSGNPCTACQAAGVGCSACGGAVGGCSSCQGIGVLRYEGPECLGVDVPNMKATRWQGIGPVAAPCDDCEAAATSDGVLVPVPDSQGGHADVPVYGASRGVAVKRATKAIMVIPDHVW